MPGARLVLHAPSALADAEAEPELSGLHGEFSFEAGSRPEDPGGTVLVVTHAAHEPWAQDLPGSLPPGRPLELHPVLVPCDPTTFVVQDAFGAPLEGASLHLSVRPGPTTAYSAYELTVTTDGKGEAQAPLFATCNRVEATDGRGARAVWYGSRRERVVLLLEEDFVVEIHVSSEHSLAGARLEHSVRFGDAERIDEEGWPLESLPAPLRLPASAMVVTQVFSLEGEGLVPVSRTIESPAPGSHHVLSFDVTAGTLAYFRVMDAVDEPIAEARVRLQWNLGERWESLDLTTDETGLAQTDRAPEGIVWATSSKPGFATRTTGPYTFPCEPAAWPINLVRSGTLRGRCTRDGEPCSDFRVVYWPNDDPTDYQTKTFRGHTDGTFALDDVPRGVLGVAADADGLLPEESVTVELEEEAFVELRLEPPHRAHGRVVDQATGEPVEGALVQPHYTRRNNAMMAWGPPAPTDAAGEFVVAGLAREPTALYVRHPDYSDSDVRVRGVPGTTVEVGTVALARRSGVTLVLVSTEPTDFSGYVAWGEGPWFPERRFDEFGAARYEDVLPGRHTVYVQHPDGSLWIVRFDHRAGLDSFVELDVTPSTTLCIDFEGFDSPPGAIRLLAPHRRGESAFREQELHGETSVCVGALPAGPVGVQVLDEASSAVAVATGELREGETCRLVVRPSTGALGVTVVDERGEPRPATLVTVAPAGNSSLYVTARTGPDGRCELTALPPGPLVAWISHVNVGDLFLELPAVEGAREETIELAPHESVDVTLLDGSTPVPFAYVRLLHPAFTQVEVETAETSDEIGHAAFGSLGPGTYDVAVVSPFTWPAQASVEAGRPAVVQVRRLGDLVVSPPSGMSGTIELHSIELDADVRTWIDAGQVSTSAPSLTTDGQHPLELHGLPRGPYAWRFRSADGREGTGTVEVRPRTTTVLEVRLP